MEFPRIYPFWINGQLALLWPKIMKSYISASTLSIFSKTLQYDIKQEVNKSDLTMSFFHVTCFIYVVLKLTNLFYLISFNFIKPCFMWSFR